MKNSLYVPSSLTQMLGQEEARERAMAQGAEEYSSNA